MQGICWAFVGWFCFCFLMRWGLAVIAQAYLELTLQSSLMSKLNPSASASCTLRLQAYATSPSLYNVLPNLLFKVKDPLAGGVVAQLRVLA